MSNHSCLTCNGGTQYHGLAIVCSKCVTPCYLGCLPDNKPETSELLTMLNLKGPNINSQSAREAAYRALRVLFANESCFTFTFQKCVDDNMESKNNESESKSAREKKYTELKQKSKNDKNLIDKQNLIHENESKENKIKDLEAEIETKTAQMHQFHAEFEVGKETLNRYQNEIQKLQQQIQQQQNQQNPNNIDKDYDNNIEMNDIDNRVATITEVKRMIKENSDEITSKIERKLDEIFGNDDAQRMKRKRPNSNLINLNEHIPLTPNIHINRVNLSENNVNVNQSKKNFKNLKPPPKTIEANEMNNHSIYTIHVSRFVETVTENDINEFIMANTTIPMPDLY